MPSASDQLSPEEIREEVLAAALALHPRARPILFECSNREVGFEASSWKAFQAEPPPITFSHAHPVVRWLRVNAEFLPIPDRRGVYSSLDNGQQAQLSSSGLAGCLPLVHDYDLIAFIGVVAPKVERVSDAFAALEQRASAWAARLHDARTAARARARAESEARSNRLAVAGQLAASIAHEVRNPLSAIRSVVQSMKEGDCSAATYPQMFSNILDEVDHVNATLTQMLGLGRNRATERQPTDLAAIAAAATEFCRAYAARRGVLLDQSGTPAIVSADSFELRQVLVNLILNACQASQKGDCIRILTSTETAAGQPSDCVVEVVDPGIGISERELGHVFDAFYTTKVDGGGLGLGIAREIVERHSGTINVTSKVGSGTRVVIRLPGHS